MVGFEAERYVAETQAELCQFVAENAFQQRKALLPRGGGTAWDYGYPADREGVVLESTGLTRIIDYPARDMTITVEAGIQMDVLAKALREENQRLPLDVSDGSLATLGGIVATNASGPRRLGHGTLRDYVIGVSAVDAQGRLFKAGGRVVKNVAGYDLCKLLVGSLGTLGMVTQLTLKLRPIPESGGIVWWSVADGANREPALERLLTSETRPVSVDLLNRDAARWVGLETQNALTAEAPILCVGFEGTQKEVDWQIECVAKELAGLLGHDSATLSGDVATNVWQTLTDFQKPAEGTLVFQASLLPSRLTEFVDRATQEGVAVLAFAGSGIVLGRISTQAKSWEDWEPSISALRRLARESHGNLIITHCDEQWKSTLPVFGEPENSWTLMSRLKSTLDPHQIFNPGRYIDGALARVS